MDRETAMKVCEAITKGVDVLTEHSKYKPLGDVLGLFGHDLCEVVVELLTKKDPESPDKMKPCWEQNPPICPV